MTNSIQYGFGSLAGAADDLQASSARVGAELEELKNLLRPMAATWTGEASENYQMHQRKWDEAAAELNMILDSIAKTVSDGNMRMKGINDAAAASWLR
ncbi:WXG100 family type VII secretion target [Corynebacterium lubricantis]|uniref:WXG100 family type VII secretion target n=1 Tax=Corynebacterium lubricantis TaxID=541095 RepID=UPI000382B0A0|nr:WXG100 family type VII secretion target [Corynebacterium lubricantis]